MKNYLYPSSPKKVKKGLKMRKLIIVILVLIIACSIANASYSSDFDFTEADRIVGALSEGISVDQALITYYMLNFQKGDCADYSCSAEESANETDCKCLGISHGEMCFDIFQKSTASKSSFTPNHATDYCLDEGTLMEGFVNCAWFDESYWLQVDCPEGFKCSDGACVSKTNTSIGPVFNISIDDNGTITHADYITMNGTRVSNLTRAVLGARNTIESADSLYVDSIHYENVTRMRFMDPVLRDVSYAELPDVFSDGMVISNTTNASIRKDDVRNAMDVDIESGSFSMVDPLDRSRLLFSGPSQLSIVSLNKSLEVNATRLDVLIGFTIPSPPFIRIVGNNTRFRVFIRDGRLHYYIEDAAFYFDGGDYQEVLRTGKGSDIMIDYQLGIVCVNLSEDAGYYYLDRMDFPASFGVENRYEWNYVFCSRKLGNPVAGKKDGYADMVQSGLNLTGAVAYLRPVAGSIDINGSFSDLYTSNSTNNALFDINRGIIRDMQIMAYPVHGTVSHMSFFGVLEDDGRYAYVAGKKHDFVRAYSTAGSGDLIDVRDDILVQRSPKSKVTIFGPDSDALHQFESTLYSND